MAFQFKKATKAAARGRIALIGPSGSGKTYSALAIATNLGKRVAVIDSERGSASKYANEFAFDVLELETFSPLTYVQAIEAASTYDVVVIDSLSHAWMGKGGALEMVDAAQRRQKTPNSYTAWRDVTPDHNALVDALIQCPAHVVATMRAKTEYVQEKDERGKTTIRKVGLAPIQRDGLEYEFDVVGEIDLDHVLSISKSRCSSLADQAIRKPGKQLAETLKAWLSDGTPAPERAPKPEPLPIAAVAEQAQRVADAAAPPPDDVDAILANIAAAPNRDAVVAIYEATKTTVDPEIRKAVLQPACAARVEAIKAVAA